MTTPLPNTPLPQPASPRFWALLPCAGTGSRAQTAQPKQYQMLAGKPLVMHTLAAFEQVDGLETVVVVAPEDVFFAGQNTSFFVAACGGKSRAASVLNGLHALAERGAQADDWVLVHDAARCLITPAQIQYLMAACQGDSVGGLLALRLADTLKCGAAGRVEATLERSDKWLAQTPQMFRLGVLQRALLHAGTQVTDESSAIEALGLQPLLVEGSAENFKVTYPQDFALAEAVLWARKDL